MPEYTREEALAFVSAIRLAIEGKVGFKWLVERLSGLSAYIDSVSAENELLRAYLDEAGETDDYETYRVKRSGPADSGAACEDA